MTTPNNKEEKIKEAEDIVIAQRIASVSLLQRKLKIGYVEGCEIMNELEKRGIVGPNRGPRPRDVLIPKLESVSPTPDSMEKCHCQRTSRYDTIDSIYKNHSIDRCWTDPTPTDSWEEEFEKKWNHDIQIPGVWNSPLKTPRTVGRGKIHYDLFDENKIKKYIKDLLSQVRQKAKEEVLRDIIVMETPTRGIEGETVMEYASSLGIDLSSNK